MKDNLAARLERLRNEGGSFAVKDIARFAVTGTDRLRYLNGQVSNALRKLSAGRAMRACVLSAKGKLDGIVWIWSEPDRLVVECDAVLAESLAVRLGRYVVADDVEIMPLPMAETVHVFGRLSTSLNGLAISRLGIIGVDVSYPFDGGQCMATSEEIELLRIEQCLPRWGAELDPDTLPAEAGLDTSAVDFDKGCYIGQEIVSRIRSVGHVNRVLRVFEVIEGIMPTKEMKYFLPGEFTSGVATVTSIHFALPRPIGLCYIRRGIPEGTVLEAPAGTSRIQLRQPACVQPS